MCNNLKSIVTWNCDIPNSYLKWLKSVNCFRNRLKFNTKKNIERTVAEYAGSWSRRASSKPAQDLHPPGGVDRERNPVRDLEQCFDNHQRTNPGRGGSHVGRGPHPLLPLLPWDRDVTRIRDSSLARTQTDSEGSSGKSHDLLLRSTALLPHRSYRIVSCQWFLTVRSRPTFGSPKPVL